MVAVLITTITKFFPYSSGTLHPRYHLQRNTTIHINLSLQIKEVRTLSYLVVLKFPRHFSNDFLKPEPAQPRGNTIYMYSNNHFCD